jgi:hypothetical protein
VCVCVCVFVCLCVCLSVRACVAEANSRFFFWGSRSYEKIAECTGAAETTIKQTFQSLSLSCARALSRARALFLFLSLSLSLSLSLAYEKISKCAGAA